MALAAFAPGCESRSVPELLGGQASIYDATPNAFSQPAPGLDREQELLFFVGNSFFNQNWVTAPASTTARDGLGPFFNARSCAGCHFKDGRGRPPERPGESSTGLLLRLGLPGRASDGSYLPDPSYGGQIQDHAIAGLSPEAALVVEGEELSGEFPDGTAYTLWRPSYRLDELGYGELDSLVMISPRVAPQMIGMGLLEAIPEEEVLAWSDPEDGNGDGISGRPNWVWDESTGGKALGRFGWKANQPSVLQQTAGAFLGDIGITTSLFPQENCVGMHLDCQGAPGGGSPEIEDEDLMKVVLYASSLAVPAMREADDAQVVEGFLLFDEIGCGSCHRPSSRTGIHPTIPALSAQTIFPYTDLLLHDMGEELADGRPDFEATGSEWRTPPLWGIGLFQTVNDHTYYLHDGRARNLMEAILWHGGEAEAARERFAALSEARREALLRFLEAL
jgi:CxxC motif-containing protein (DUF1111 family)